MKLPLAVGLGAIAAVAVPYALPPTAGHLGEIVQGISRSAQLAGFEFRFSLTILLIVTSFAWAFFIWSDK
jgi:RAB protein geranylgeranyltransferase component A